SAHECLDRPVDIVERHTLLQYFVAVYLNKFLGYTGEKRRAQTRYLRPFAGSVEESAQVFRQELHVVAGAILEDKGEPSGRSNARNRGRRKAERDRKSTRLNSSHVKISYAVFCLKKKKKQKINNNNQCQT